MEEPQPPMGSLQRGGISPYLWHLATAVHAGQVTGTSGDAPRRYVQSCQNGILGRGLWIGLRVR